VVLNQIRRYASKTVHTTQDCQQDWDLPVVDENPAKLIRSSDVRPGVGQQEGQSQEDLHGQNDDHQKLLSLVVQLELDYLTTRQTGGVV
jgi:hypothetical protein